MSEKANCKVIKSTRRGAWDKFRNRRSGKQIVWVVRIGSREVEFFRKRDATRFVSTKCE